MMHEDDKMDMYAIYKLYSRCHMLYVACVISDVIICMPYIVCRILQVI